MLELLGWTPRLQQRYCHLWVVVKFMLLWRDDSRKLLFLHLADVLIYDDFSSLVVFVVRALESKYHKIMVSFLPFHSQPVLISVHSIEGWRGKTE